MKKEEIDLRFYYPYNTPGRCRKCDHKTYRAGQVGAIPPGIHCPICGWRDFDMKGMGLVDWDAQPVR